jgi:hypothetical protein
MRARVLGHVAQLLGIPLPPDTLVELKDQFMHTDVEGWVHPIFVAPDRVYDALFNDFVVAPKSKSGDVEYAIYTSGAARKSERDKVPYISRDGQFYLFNAFGTKIFTNENPHTLEHVASVPPYTKLRPESDDSAQIGTSLMRSGCMTMKFVAER